MIVGMSSLPPSFPPSRTQAFYIIKRQKCLNICNRVYIHFSYQEHSINYCLLFRLKVVFFYNIQSFMVLNYFVKMKIEQSGSVFYTFVSITDINRIQKIQQHKEFCTKNNTIVTKCNVIPMWVKRLELPIIIEPFDSTKLKIIFCSYKFFKQLITISLI